MEIQPLSIATGPVASNGTEARVAQKNESEAPPLQKMPSGTFSSEQVKKMVEAIGAQLKDMNVSLNFTPYGEKGEKMAVIVTDKDTGKVIREIPSKELQDLYMKMSALVGILINRRT